MSRESVQQDEEFDSLLRQVAQLDAPPLGARLPRSGEIVGEKYRIEERIGAGGMGAVFRATHLVSHKHVAIKWLLRSTSDTHVRKRFLREARVAGRVDHPNVVNVYDVGEQADCGYLVMELLNGEPLRAQIARGPLGIAEAIDVLLPAMRGVAAVHQAGVIHRDLKPDNIFLCRGPGGTPREAKVLDFGISAMSTRDAEDATLTGDGAVLGTLAYMSPEQLQKASDVDVRTDVYAFGVVLYEALTGRLPFESESYPQLAMAIVSARPTPPSELRADLPGALERVLLRALAKAREERYATIEDLIVALTPFAAGGAVAVAAQAGAAASVAGARTRARRHARALAACVVVVLGCAAWWLSTRATAVRPASAALRPAPVNAPAPHPAVPAANVGAIAPAAPPSITLQTSVPAKAASPLPVSPRPTLRAKRPHRAPGAAPGQDVSVQAGQSPRSGMLSVDQL